MEMERRVECWFCWDPIASRNATISEEDIKLYQDIFECSKAYLKKEDNIIRLSIDWSDVDGLLSPFCANCFKSAVIINQVSQELEEIQKNLSVLTEKFRQEVELRVSKNSKEKCDIDLIKEETEDHIQEENDFIFDEGDGCPSLYSEEEGNFSENILSNISPHSDDDEEVSSDNIVDSEYIRDEKPNITYTNQWPKIVLERLEFDNDGILKKWKSEESYSSSVMGQRIKTIGAATKLQHTFQTGTLDSNGLCNNYDPANESSSVKSSSTYQPVYMVMKNEAGDFLCDICGKPFKRQSVLLTHRASHNGEDEKSFKCVTCSKGFNLLSSLEGHLCTHNTGETNSFECSICKLTFENRNRLKVHAKLHGEQAHDSTQNDKEKESRCNTCGKLCANRTALKHHGYRSHNMRQKCFLCEICGVKFKIKQALKNHTEIVHEKILKYQCTTCGRFFGRLRYLREHEETHKDLSERRTLKCEICGDRYFSQRVALLRHRRHFHTVYTHGYTGDSFTCETCGKTFDRKLTLKVHVRSHTGEKPFSCNVCGLTFTTSSNRISHTLTHTGEKRHKCSFCEKSFAKSGNLKTHVRTHTGERPYSCTICLKTFTKSERYKIHLRTHTGEKPYSCDVCGSAFASSSSLKKHTLTHTGEKRHKCSFCEKSFSQSQHLKTHVRIHTGERPYCCTICGRTFSDRSTWYKHEKNHKQNS